MSGGPSGFEGRIALVTGAAGGIGSAVVRKLLAEGARVIAADVAPAPPEDGNVWPAILDVCDSAAVEALVADVEATWGAIDFGVNVAGILATDLVTETSDDTWRPGRGEAS